MEIDQKSIVISIETLVEYNDYVIVKITEVVKNTIVESVEKGIKDSSGDIVRFEKCKEKLL